jgi:hypothetical protein
MNRYESLLTNGYYIGNLNEIVTDMQEFDSYIVRIKKTFTDCIEDNYIYRNVIQMHPEYSMFVELKDLDERREIIKKNNYSIGQQWYESVSSTAELLNCKYYFQDIVKNFITIPYPSLNRTTNNIRYNDSFTVFTPGDFIENHIDGQDLARLCVVLIYLSDPNDYNDGGGEFVLPDNNITLLPLKGKYVILDFTKNNVRHAVNVVKNNFLRYSYIGFIYNIDMENK